MKVILWLAMSIAVVLLSFTTWTMAHATSVPCAGIADMLAQLDAKYGERQMFVGRFVDGSRFILMANPTGASWTALVVGPTGKACIGAIGPRWTPGDPPGPQGTEG